jgi:hypothetical protein
MRYAIIADIHANLAAFTAVLDDVELTQLKVKQHNLPVRLVPRLNQGLS